MGKIRSLFLSHGAPSSIEDAEWMAALKNFGESLEKINGVLVLSAHWVEKSLYAGPLTPTPLIYDFWGFPERLYRVRYSAPIGSNILDALQDLPGIGPIMPAPGRGLDHGMWVPMTGLFPSADIPVLGLSLPGTDPGRLYALGQTLAPLREKGILVVGSGGMTHNLGALISNDKAPVVHWAHAFDRWVTEKIQSGDHTSLINFWKEAPNASLAHPTIEHFAPLFVAMGAAGGESQPSFPVDMFRYGSLSLRSVAFWSSDAPS